MCTMGRRVGVQPLPGCPYPRICNRLDAPQEFLAANPDAKLISLGIGDTTHPLPGPIADAMANYAKGLGTLEGYASHHEPTPAC
jgi:LL-diaminopimelate aminotransferase